MEDILPQLLKEIGVTVDGAKPFDVKVNDKRFFYKVLRDQSIGAGDAYVDGLWDCEQLDELFYRICKAKVYNNIYSKWKENLITLQNSLVNQQSISKSSDVANVHYNLGNNLYEAMLGKSMAYTCGYWKEASNLDEAQFAKYELCCQKLKLRPGDKVLEIGCGWGGLAKYMAEKYQCEILAIDIAREPSKYAIEHCKGLPVTVIQCDYRETFRYNPQDEKFDKIISVGVLEHVGNQNYRTLMTIARDYMKEDGIFLLHSIGGNTSRNYCEPWINKYIFPHGVLPSLKLLGEAFEGLFIVEDLQNFGAYYEKTLLAWNKNLDEHWPQLKNQYDEKFKRMMRYYLLSCAGGFRAREMQLWQFVLTPNGMKGGYQSPR